ncbi:hypothetical protein EVA_14509 [gut metagenome]|uniref:Uncharacterized protein n=1 Tax=gut metagenome TaxID=749906 RepID=J9FQZ8_9ZZZZ
MKVGSGSSSPAIWMSRAASARYRESPKTTTISRMRTSSPVLMLRISRRMASLSFGEE